MMWLPCSLQGGGDGANGRATGKTGTVKVQSREEAAVAAYSGNGSGSGSSTDEDAISLPPADAATPLGDHNDDCTLARCLICMSCVQSNVCMLQAGRWAGKGPLVTVEWL